MDITRNQYYLVGLVLFFLGVQFRMIDTVVLTPEVTQMVAERIGHPLATVNAGAQGLLQTDHPPAKGTFHPPEWLGWMLVSVGGVLVLHSWAMPKPG